MKRLFSLLFLLALVAGGGLIAYQLTQQQNIDPDDTNALYGGRFEYGYVSAGFFANFKGASLETCGVSFLSPKTGITASHCLDHLQDAYIGLGLYTDDKSQLVKVEKAVQKIGWVESKDRRSDFAVLTLEDTDKIQYFAEVATPVEGCFYRIVAYGRTENDTAGSIARDRKSAKLCVFDIERDIFKIRGDDSGICFGDSGSPIYFEDTNKVVGVIASIQLSEDNPDEPCGFNNTGIVVRTDNNSDFIANNIQDPPPQSALGNADGLTIDTSVSLQTFIDNNLASFNNLSEKQRLYIMFIGVIIGAVIVLLAIIVMLLRKPQ